MSTSPTDLPPLGKHLASSDKAVRDTALQSLVALISDSSHDAFSGIELAKLWKGIFYCFWMSDKPIVQQALAAELSELLLAISNFSSSLYFLRGFWDATVREWNGIDRLRIDKYYMLVRRFVNASFRLLSRNDWDPGMCNQYNDILTRKGAPLCPTDIRIPAGLTYHLCDIYLEELDKASDKLSPAPLSIVLKPFITLAAQTPTKTIHERVQSAVINPLLAALQPPISTGDPPSSKRQKLRSPEYIDLLSNACSINPGTEGVLPKTELRRALLRQIFDVASEQGTKDANRRRLYALWSSEDDDEVESKNV